jgi:DNA-binding FrmR family transcriptional regulator
MGQGAQDALAEAGIEVCAGAEGNTDEAVAAYLAGELVNTGVNCDHHDHEHGHIHENTKAVLNRLSRAIGHLQSVRRMVEDGRDCTDVLVQVAAVRSAIDNTGKVILQDHLKHCIIDAAREGDEQAIDDLCKAIDKYIK